ncbi:MAG: hypothetical protein INH41_18265 [Myxococcaceae bacterium]|jgi:hypothetical protein|nr:hypothetical protein [Myxococcaceae bacterium]MCA3014332.1 hypothetical protein [Myxococcaceae bacterium]
MRFAAVVALAALTLTACKSREEKLKAAEDEGNLLVATKAKLLKGAAEAVKKEGKEAAQTLAESTGEVVKGLGTGIEKGFKEVTLDVHESLAPQGLTVTRATRGEEGTAAHTITVYMSFEKGWTGTVELRAYDVAGREVGRAKTELAEKEANARYVDFRFDPRTPLLTATKFDVRATPKE